MPFVPDRSLQAAPDATRVRRSVQVFAAAALALLSAGAAPRLAHGEVSIEAVDTTRLRVCADPANMPYSNEAGEGFENKIAELLAKGLGVPLEYTWYPLGGGFVRNTLGEKRCDLMFGVPAGSGAVLNTNPYLRVTYVMVYRKDSGITARTLVDPAMKKLKIGTIAGTPPNYLLQELDLLDRIQPYPMRYDTRYRTVGQDMVEDLKNGVIDVALMAGPDAGYWLKQEKLEAEVIPLQNAKHPFGRMDSYITIGVRQGENDWKRKLNKLLDLNREEIDAILARYGIPILPMKGPVTPAAEGAAAPAAPSPAGTKGSSAPQPAPPK